MGKAGKLLEWIEREYRIAAGEMLHSISATNLSLDRPAFGQEIRPARGSILASPVPGFYDPEPDYFFHWLRDSAVVIDAVAELIGDGTLGEEGAAIVADFVRFSLGLDALDGRELAADPAYGVGVAPQAQQYLRPREELTEIHGDRIRTDVRFNPDGSLDVTRWARPQLDGPALRALVLMRYARGRTASREMRALIDADVDFTLRYAGGKGYDIWEERLCDDYYTRSIQSAALAAAAAVAIARDENERASAYSAAAERLEERLDAHWSTGRSCYLSAATDGPGSDRDVDFAVVLAAVHSKRSAGRHSVLDPRMQATLATLADIFDTDYVINRQRPGAAPALGRFRGDVYQSGGAWYVSTLGAAEFHYRLAVAVASEGDIIDVGPENRRFFAQAGLSGRLPRGRELVSALIARGDAFMETVRQFTPSSGALSEQFDQTDGRQTSARHLAWSYAAFITARAARRRAT